MTLTIVEQSLLLSLGYTARRHGKKYCYPSHKTLQENLKTYYGLNVCIKTVQRALKHLDDMRVIHRQRRNRFLGNGQWRQRTTLYKLYARAFRLIAFLSGTVNVIMHGFRATFMSPHKNFKENYSSVKVENPPEGDSTFHKRRKKQPPGDINPESKEKGGGMVKQNEPNYHEDWTERKPDEFRLDAKEKIREIIDQLAKHKVRKGEKPRWEEQSD